MRARSGFTLIELLIVVLVVLVLAGMGIPAWNAVAKRARIGATRNLIAAFAAAIQRDPQPALVVGVGPQSRVREPYDFNRDGILDGRPDLDPGFTGSYRDEAREVDYLGAVATARISLPRNQLDPAQRPLDGWKRPLRIGFATGVYGANRFGIWSTGPDGVDGNGDDLRSW